MAADAPPPPPPVAAHIEILRGEDLQVGGVVSSGGAARLAWRLKVAATTAGGFSEVTQSGPLGPGENRAGSVRLNREARGEAVLQVTDAAGRVVAERRGRLEPD